MNFIKSNIFFLFLITISVFGLYGKSIYYGYTELDDATLTYKSAVYYSDIKNIPKLFLTDCYHDKFTQYYRPVLSLSFAAETLLFGPDSKIYHLTNIILFILSLYIIYLFASKFKKNKNILKALILIITVHPVLLSVPVWIPARNDSLLTIFLTASFINFINWLNTDKIKYFIFHFIFFTAALFTKETSLIMIIIYPLIIYCLNLKITYKQFKQNILSAAVLITIYFILRYFAVTGINFSAYSADIYGYIKNIYLGFAKYIYYLFIPGNTPVMLYNLHFSVSDILPVFTFVFLVFLYIKNIINRKTLLFSAVYFTIAIIPTFLQEDYTFLTHRFLLGAAGIIIISENIMSEFIIKHPVLKKYFIILFFTVFSALTYISFVYSDRYRNSDIFWTNSYLNAPESHLACNEMYRIYMNKNEYYTAEQFIKKAVSVQNRTEYIINLITVQWMISGDFDTAEKNYIEIADKSGFQKEIALSQLAKLYYLKNDLNKAIEYAEKAVEIKPYNTDYLTYLGNYYALNRDFDKAENIYGRLLKSDSKNEYYRYILSTIRKDKADSEIN